MASQRSGSSFLGELFNRNQDVFYSFEPIRPLTFAVLRGELDNNQFENEAIAKLSNTLKCKDVRVYKRTGKSRTDRKLFDLTKACKNKRHVAVKEIRFYKLDTLRTLAEDPNLNFKIIHLVRDPRAIINSRENSFFSNHDFKRKRVPWDEVTDLCKDLQHNLDLITTLPQWLKGKYFLVRYEDLALRPLEATRDIYNFSGMPMDEDVEKWVYENTQTEQGGDLSTTRNSTERVTAWRNELSFSVIADIQNKCKEPMEMLGYISLQDQTQQNTLSLPVFTDETEFFNFPYIL
ncbi:carbohydrate sulfotransferase 1-like [Saccoglossus kowalevskii]|uniref:Carbohydrate sulfotransferase 1-like n=1 Tax=Saccoglossus kowalevskii TaxID=10224 RepID=A0ABM0M3T0_SACKO|nr:PREDICTED: carbohydrate sulfotransferase 1-like [Saccoglossus kowalevskii]